jgi:hypothetical protein
MRAKERLHIPIEWVPAALLNRPGKDVQSETLGREPFGDQGRNDRAVAAARLEKLGGRRGQRANGGSEGAVALRHDHRLAAVTGQLDFYGTPAGAGGTQSLLFVQRGGSVGHARSVVSGFVWVRQAPATAGPV